MSTRTVKRRKSLPKFLNLGEYLESLSFVLGRIGKGIREGGRKGEDREQAGAGRDSMQAKTLAGEAKESLASPLCNLCPFLSLIFIFLTIYSIE